MNNANKAIIKAISEVVIEICEHSGTNPEDFLEGKSLNQFSNAYLDHFRDRFWDHLQSDIACTLRNRKS